MNFNENIRNLRKEKGLSQEYFAEKLGVTRQTISKWETGAAMPDLKKLTEIADFFNVSMDTILGMEIKDKSSVQSSSADNGHNNNTNNNENNYNTEYQKEYANQLFSIAYQNQQVQNHANHKALKTVAVLLSIAIACSIFGLIYLFDMIDSKINNLQNQINMLSSQINTQQNYTYDENEYSEFSYEFVGIKNTEEANIINTKFSYAPNTYPKNALIYLHITNSNGAVQRVDMQLNDGIFTANTDIDVTSPPESIYIYIDDGDVITRELSDFYEIMPFDLIHFENSYDSFNNLSMVQWKKNHNDTFQISEIYYVAEKNGKEIQSKKLTIDEYADENLNEYYTASFDESIFDNSNNSELYYTERYIKAIDKNGILFKFNIDTEQYKITFPNGKSITNYY